MVGRSERRKRIKYEKKHIKEVKKEKQAKLAPELIARFHIVKSPLKLGFHMYS